MTERRQSVSAPHMRISYPVFSDEEHPIYAEEMNAFYKTFREVATAYGAELNQSREGGVRILTAEYRTAFTDRGCVVEYIVTVRRRGRVIGRKKLMHAWETGALIPEKKREMFWRMGKKKHNYSIINSLFGIQASVGQ